MHPRFPVLWLRPLARFIYRELIDHRTGNLLVSDSRSALGIPHQELYISPFAVVVRFRGSFKRFYAEVFQWTSWTNIAEGGM